MEELVASLADLGFCKRDCVDALRITKFDPEPAAEVLVSGKLAQIRSAMILYLTRANQLYGPLPGLDPDAPEQPVPEQNAADEDPVLQQFTPEERAKSQELERLGFDRSQVVQVFLACDKDPELAANCLLSETKR
jgi:hypothetical protein